MKAAMMPKSRSEKLQDIKDYVDAERKKRGINKLGRERRMELSGISQGPDGDIISLIEIQLLYTIQGHGAWGELDNDEILDETHRVMERLRDG